MLRTTQTDQNGQKIVNMADPTSAQDAATKNYVDTNAVTLTGTQTLSNKTLASPRVDYLRDNVQFNRVLSLTAGAPSYNYIEMGSTNNGIAPTIKAKPGNTDTNVGLNLQTTGTGSVQANGINVATVSDTQTLTNKDLTSGTNTFPTFNQNTTGNAATATKLASARTVQTNLASTSTASFDGSANITPGVTGTLPVANGGTGVTSSTGTGSVVLSTSPQLTTPVLMGGASAPSTPATGTSIIYGVGTGTVRPHFINSSGTDETLVTSLTPTWTAPTLLNSWTSFGSGFNSPGYFLDQLGYVHLRGLIMGGTATLGTTIFVLPIGYRPTSGTHILTTSSNDVYGQIRIDTSGNVKVQVASSNWLCLDNLVFPIF